MSKGRDYKLLISDYIKDQMVILGPAVALSKVDRVMQIKVDKNGGVLQVSGDPQEALDKLVGEFAVLVGDDVAQNNLLKLLKKYSLGEGKSFDK